MSLRLRMPRRWLAALSATAALVGSALVAAPAAAAGNVVFRDHMRVEDSHIEQEFHEDFCDVPFLVLWEGSGVLKEMATTRRDDSLWYFKFHITIEDVYTNLDTGASFRVLNTFTGGDQKLSWDADGNLVVDGMDRFSSKLFDSEGKLVAVNAGLTAFHAVVDLNDLEDPEDDEVLEDTITKDHGLRQWGERDFCADIEAFLG